MAKENSKRGRYSERKERVNFTLTPSALQKLDLRSSQLGLNNRSELIEKISRGEVSMEQAIVLGECAAS